MQVPLLNTYPLSSKIKCWSFIRTGMKTFHAFKLSDGVLTMLINVKMPMINGISTFISMINFILSWVEHVFLQPLALASRL